MRNFLIAILLLMSLKAYGQSLDPCIPNIPSDTLIINQCYDSAQCFFNDYDYLNAASCFHKAEKIIPNCSEVHECLAACYWEYYQDCDTYDIKYMLLAKKYLVLCQQDIFIPKNNRTHYQNCLNEINGILDMELVSRYYSEGRYYGEMHNEKKDGFGIFYYNDGRRYEGRWIDDKKEDLEGELYDSKNELIYKGVFSNDETMDFAIVNLKEELEYWDDIKDSNDKQKSINQVCDSISNSINNKINQFITDGEKITKRGKLDRNFIDINYSLSGYYSLRIGSMYPSKWGLYNCFGGKVDLENMETDGISSIRYTLGALYAPTNWMYVYAGGGIIIDSLENSDSFVSTADCGLLFRLGVVSLSTGIQIDDFLQEPSFDLNFGFGFNFAALRMKYTPYIYYMYSPMAPYGLMCAWYRNSLSGYFKIQIPMYGDMIQELIAPNYKENPVRYSYTGGVTTSISSWLSFYTGLGLGVLKDSLDGSTKNQSLDAEIGVSLRASNILSVTAGLHGVNITDKERFFTYDVGIGINTWKAFYKRANHTIWEYSYSETADVGLMNGFIYDWYGYYSRVQLTNPFQDNKQYNKSDKWNGSRYSLTVGPMIALTDWLFLHGGVGMGLYRKDDDNKTSSMGFEAELGLGIRAWIFDISYGPHWCRIGAEDAFLDYNLGVGLNIPMWLGNSAFGNYGALFWRYRYSKTAQIGFDLGCVWDEGGFYFGMQGGIPFPFRLNLSVGAVFTPSALIHFSLGPGIGFYSTNGADASFGFDMEAMVSFVLWKFSVSVGVKLCRIGSSEMFFEPIYSFGGFEFD